jgi:hypothetical protein
MKKYLSTLHTKPTRHKKHFAFIVSSSVTLAIFLIWTLVSFGHGGVAAQEVSTTNQVREVGPLESLTASLSSSFNAILVGFGALKSDVETNINLQTDYTEMRDNALDKNL